MANTIVIRGAKEHNLKNVTLEIPRDKLVVFTGLSGSGKSTLAMDTIFAEGQRRYLESLSSYARQFLGQMEKPDVESIDGLSPTIAIDQKAASHNPRSTVGTVTEIYDYLRLLYARIGIPHCPMCGRSIKPLSIEQMVEHIFDQVGSSSKPVLIFAPVVRSRKGEYHQLLQDLYTQGFGRARINGKIVRLNEPVELARYKQHSIDVIVDELPAGLDELSRLTEAVETAVRLSDGLVGIIYPDGKEELLNQKLSCAVDGGSLPELEPRLFSFNSPQGACPTCDGLGVERSVDPNLVMPDPTKTIADGGLVPWNYRGNNYYGWLINHVAHYYRIPVSVRLQDLTEKQREILLYGPGHEERIPAEWESKAGAMQRFSLRFNGLINHLTDRYRKTDSPSVREEIERYMAEIPCPSCEGARLKPEALLVTIDGKHAAAVTALSVTDALQFFTGLKLATREQKIADRLLAEINNRLRFLNDVGLEYLTLSRAAMTLSGGEAQRIRLASQVGSALVGVLYILDEPTIGLHPRDNTRLITTLKHLRDIGNSVIVIEHDEETIQAGDWIVDIGPGAGRLGGDIIFSGTLADLKKHPSSLTAQYLRGEQMVPVPDRRRPFSPKKLLTVTGAKEHNLKNLRVSIPLGVFVAVTGVSGSGKSTLVNDILYRAVARKLHRTSEPPGAHDKIEGLEHLDKIIVIDQAPIGRTPRSNPATYTGVFTAIRDLFTQTKEAKLRGYGPGRFSFNVSGGRCDACAGDGFTKIEMQFLPDVFLPCDICHGARYNRETLQVKYRDKTIADVLSMTVSDALEFFQALHGIRDKLKTLSDVGLGYIQLGQAANTLSGGEAQRIKLASELSKRATGRTFYILDEPTTGLHFDDVKKLLEVLHRLVDQGNSVLVIEHNLDVIKTADWIVDLGPEGGAKGGELIADGTPEDLAQNGRSYTGAFLKKVLKKKV